MSALLVFLLVGREKIRTVCPWLTISRATWLPTNPVAPVTSVVIKCGKLRLPAVQAPRGLRASQPFRCRRHFRGHSSGRCFHGHLSFSHVRSARREDRPSFRRPSS